MSFPSAKEFGKGVVDDTRKIIHYKKFKKERVLDTQ
jgi:hypothetical protein